MKKNVPSYTVAALYKFVFLPNYEDMQPVIQKAAIEAGLTGTILLAEEGINGTVAGPKAGIDALHALLEDLVGLENLEWKESYAEENPFFRMKVRLKKEIVTLGVEGVEPAKCTGTYVKPENWNALISDPDTIVIDTRNDYEIAIGTFKNAVNPETVSFRDFPVWFEENREELSKAKKVAMFCTGGIRCEKSTAYLKAEGIENVYHLKGGILKYLEEVDEDESLWEGECFVFDQRVSVGHGLKLGSYDQCHACRRPISEEDKQSDKYIPSISCPHCHDEYSDKQRQRFAERQKQIELAEKRGEQHLGAPQFSRKTR